MMSERFVRVSILQDSILTGKFLGYMWGLLEKSNFRLLYTRSRRACKEVGFDYDAYENKSICAGLMDHEVNSAVDVEDCWTPNAVYVAAAKHALLGEVSDE